MKHSDNDYVILVSANNTETGTMEKMEAHRKGILHRAISVFICNSKGEWLLQRRAYDKYHSNGLWTNACCSHPLPHESALDAANRRLREEMGMKASLNEIFTFTYKAELDNGFTEHEFDHVFLGFSDDEPEINTQEVMEWRYVTYPDLLEEVTSNPDAFTVWFRQIFTGVNNYIRDKKSR